VRAVSFDGAAEAQPAAGVIESIRDADAVIVAPSNPFLSVDPILAVPAIRQALIGTAAPVVAVSPVIGGKAVKGPTAKMMAELGFEVSAETVARHYAGMIDALLVDERDPRADLPIPHDRADTLMTSLDDRIRVACAALALADRVRR
jgi:LPPG:FO 2-phospho-L-lactate transferase